MMNVVKLVPKPLRAAINKSPYLAEKLTVLAEDFNLFLSDLGHRREICPYNGIFTMLSAAEREYIFKLAKLTDNCSSIVEIGCYAGGSAFFLGKGAAISGTHVFSVDPFASFPERQDEEYGMHGYFSYKPSKAQVEAALKKRGLGSTITLIEGFSQDVARKWSDGNIGLLSIDANHKQAMQDFYAWKPYLSPKAIVAFHDATTREEVSRDLARIIEKESAKIIARVDSIAAITLPNSERKQ
jgi:predicted O-methyltransferase YrrM